MKKIDVSVAKKKPTNSRMSHFLNYLKSLLFIKMDKLNKQSQAALCILTQSAIWLTEFSSDLSHVIETLEDSVPTETISECDIGSVFTAMFIFQIFLFLVFFKTSFLEIEGQK